MGRREKQGETCDSEAFMRGIPRVFLVWKNISGRWDCIWIEISVNPSSPSHVTRKARSTSLHLQPKQVEEDLQNIEEDMCDFLIYFLFLFLAEDLAWVPAGQTAAGYRRTDRKIEL